MIYFITLLFLSTLALQLVLLFSNNKIKKRMDELTQAVTDNTSVVESAITLINGFAQRLADAGTDPAKLKALADSLNSEKDKLAAAVAANTPAA